MNNFKKTKKITLVVGVIGIIALIVGITVWKTTRKTINSSQQNSQKHKEKLYKLLKKTDFKIEQNYIKSIEEFEYNKALGSYHIIFKNITNTTFDVYIDDVIETQIGKGEINENKIIINFDDTFISETEKNPETIKRFFIRIKNSIKNQRNFNSDFSKINSIKKDLVQNTLFSYLIKTNTKNIEEIKNKLSNLSKYFFNNNLLNIIKNIKKYNITFDEINKKTKSKDLSTDLFNFFNLDGDLLIDLNTITLKKIKKIKTFLKELQEIKSEIQELILKKLEDEINVLLNDKNTKEIIKAFKEGLLILKDLEDEKIEYNENYFNNNGVVSNFAKTKFELLKQIKTFLCSVKTQKENLLIMLNNRTNKIQEINSILLANNEAVKKIIINFKNEFLLESDWYYIMKTAFLYNQNFFDNEGGISKEIKSDLGKLEQVKIFIDLIKDKKGNFSWRVYNKQKGLDQINDLIKTDQKIINLLNEILINNKPIKDIFDKQIHKKPNNDELSVLQHTQLNTMERLLTLEFFQPYKNDKNEKKFKLTKSTNRLMTKNIFSILQLFLELKNSRELLNNILNHWK